MQLSFDRPALGEYGRYVMVRKAMNQFYFFWFTPSYAWRFASIYQ